MASRSVCFVCAHSLQIKISAEKKERYETETSERKIAKVRQLFFSRIYVSLCRPDGRTAGERGENGLNGMCQINGKEHKCFVPYFSLSLALEQF